MEVEHTAEKHTPRKCGFCICPLMFATFLFGNMCYSVLNSFERKNINKFH